MVTSRVVNHLADCHAGPDRIADFEFYTPVAHREALGDYVACAEAFDAAHAETGLRGAAGAGRLTGMTRGCGTWHGEPSTWRRTASSQRSYSRKARSPSLNTRRSG